MIDLRSLERGLVAAGAILAASCATALLQMYAVSRWPVPAPAVRRAASSPPGMVRDGPPVAADKPSSGEWVARLEAPSAHFSATVLQGTNDAILARAAGHLEETPLPGQAGNVGIAGHRDTVFRPLRRLRLGDPLVLTTADRVYHYNVSSTDVVRPSAVWVLNNRGRPTLTLVTCYPFDIFGSAPDRYIVRADLASVATR